MPKQQDRTLLPANFAEKPPAEMVMREALSSKFAPSHAADALKMFHVKHLLFEMAGAELSRKALAKGLNALFLLITDSNSTFRKDKA
ncbi:MAG: hypothetical protein FWG66_00925 [Spirochaetes bacterium]|nr:hypothetical protein [Spirochaetota bacterium]